jgi:Protein of unknown function (DUF1553)./Protein of unknown function (DUF1549)./Planctomycete cytochrome C./Clostridium neurotoxin, N-terminal receptor binding.
MNPQSTPQLFRRSFLLFGSLMAFVLLAATPVISADPTKGRPLEYNVDVRPILADACFACHGADSASRKAGLRLDQREAAIELSAINPGHPETSELIRRIRSTDPEEVMPPPETKKVLTPEQIDILVRWIEQGAEYQPHWSFIAPQKGTPPDVNDEQFVKNPIDQFVLAKLKEAGLTPAPPADRRTLARRVSLDLTGLPPSPEVVEAFVQDQRPDAYERLVDSLLASPAWGEHRARYWMDYARYADTHGIHFDNYREMWSYRDWVINAFNANMPYDQFTIESLAGDLLPNATIDQQIASGFNRCNMTTNEGGIIDEEYLVLYTRDRTETTAQVWMGLTAGCAVCHSHKFDPISQKEFYEMAAFFNNTTQRAKDGNVKDTPPIIYVPRMEDREAWETNNRLLAEATQAVEKRKAEARGEFENWLANAGPGEIEQSIPSEGLLFHAPLNEEGAFATASVEGEIRQIPLLEGAEWDKGKSGGRAVKIAKGPVAEIPDVGDFAADQEFTVSAWIKAPRNVGNGAIVARMDNVNRHRGWDLWIEGRQIAMHVIDTWPENALKVVSKERIPADKWVYVTVTYNGKRDSGSVKIYFNGEEKKTTATNDRLTGDIRTEVPLKIGSRHTEAPASGVAIHDLRIYEGRLFSGQIKAIAKSGALIATLKKDVASRKPEEINDLFDWWLEAKDSQYQEVISQVREYQKQIEAIKSRGTIAHVMQEKPDEPMAYILNRGEYDQRLDPVKPGTPAFLPPFPVEFPRNRLGFAQWLLLPEQPLTARVTVNRCWQEVFGTGLVKTSDDFGVMGEIPQHQALLDWLAVDFVESGWDLKRLYKLMVMSGTYQQAAIVTEEKRERDPDNRLLSRGPRFRMDAEMVRDYALAASGILVQKIGGPSLKPYQPEGIWEVVGMRGSDTRNYVRDSGESLYRRSVYTFVKRMAPPPSMEIFNAPNREYCVVRRERTNTPLQALVTLNDEQFVEAARFLAQRAMREGGPEADSRLDFLTRRLLCRELTPREREIVHTSLANLTKYYQAHPDDAALLIRVGESKPDETLPVSEFAAWTMLTNQLMNLDEVLNK